MITHMLAVCCARFVRGKSLSSSQADTDVRERHACAHFMGVAQSRPDRGPIEAQYGAHSRPIGKTPQTVTTSHNQIVIMISLHILLFDIAIHSCFLNGPRPGLVMGLDWASTGPRLGHVGSSRHDVRQSCVRHHSYVSCAHLFAPSTQGLCTSALLPCRSKVLPNTSKSECE